MAAAFLVKSEPGTYPYSRLAQEGRVSWDGIRNYEARNTLREMKRGDRVYFYHSGAERRVVGVGRVTRAPHPDPTAPGEDWSAVEIAAEAALPQPVTLATLRADPTLGQLELVRRPRLSVTRVTPREAARLEELAGLRSGRASPAK